MINKLRNIFSKYKTLTAYLNSTILLFFVGIISSFVSYRYIDPDLMGIWVALVTFEVYFTFIRLGIPNGMNRELPYALGTGNKDKAMQYASTTMAYSIFCALIVVVIAPVFMLYANFNFSSINYWIVFAVVLFRMVTEPYSTYLSGTFRTNDNFDKLSKIQYIQSLIRLGLILLVVLFHFKGYVLMQFIIASTNLIQLHIVRPFHIKPKFIWETFKDLFKVGFPIFIISYLIGVIESLPRLFLIRNATSLEMGLLSPVLLLLSAVAVIPMTITNYIYPKFSFSLGKDNNISPLRKKMMYIYGISFLISIGISLIVYFFIDSLIVFFPKYIDSVQYIKLACIVVLFISYKLGTALPIVLKKWKWLWLYTFIYAIAQIGSIYVLNKYMEDKLEVVVFSMIFSSLILFIFSIILILNISNKVNILTSNE